MVFPIATAIKPAVRQISTNQRADLTSAAIRDIKDFMPARITHALRVVKRMVRFI